MTSISEVKKRVFFSRGMDELIASEVKSRDTNVTEALLTLGMSIVNPYKLDDARRNCISGISEIVEEDLRLLAQSDIVIADLSLPKRNYIGAMIEIARAYDLGKPIYVWVGESENEKRIWLKYHATAITKDFEGLIELLDITFTDKGQRRNQQEIIAYYSDVAPGYGLGVAPGYGLGHEGRRLPHATLNEDLRQIHDREWKTIKKWIQTINVEGTIVDLGSGTGQWVPIWAKHATRIVCIDASVEMLDISKSRNNSPIVNHIEGNLLDTTWLEQTLKQIDEIDVIVLGFVAGSLTLEQEKLLLATLRKVVAPGTMLILLENQSSIFSDAAFFSRTEIQKRYSLNGSKTFRLFKRNFLSQDVKRILDSWGKTTDFFYTDNYFIGGLAQAN